MSAPPIPNLLSLRRGGLRGRGRGRGGSNNESARPPISASKDEVIQRTDQDAATSRLSAVDAGYLDDPFAKLLAPGSDVSRRLPLMNRGTYVRTSGIDKIVDTFLASPREGKKQIISLGAGSDTRFFRITRKLPDTDIVYHELDFESNTTSKINRLQTPQVVAAVKSLCSIDLRSEDFHYKTNSSRLTSSAYDIHPQDLRTLPQTNELLPGIDASLPTLLISECCLIYLSPADADAVLAYFAKIFPSETPLAIVIYEPIRPYDAFGRTMVSNLTARGIQLQTLEKYAGLQEQRERLITYGFHAKTGDQSQCGSGGAEAADINFIWQNWIDEAEKERIDGLEWMDEVEEFVLLAKHYCIAWGWRSFLQGDDWPKLLAQSGGGQSGHSSLVPSMLG